MYNVHQTPPVLKVQHQFSSNLIHLSRICNRVFFIMKSCTFQ